MAKIEVKCNCGRMLKVSDKHAGKSGHCKDCGATIAIPSAASDNPLATAPIPSVGGDSWATLPVSVADDADAAKSMPVARDTRHEMLVRLLKAELDACGFGLEESSALFPVLSATRREQPRTIEADLEIVQKIRLRVEKRTEERVRRTLTEKLLSVLNRHFTRRTADHVRSWQCLGSRSRRGSRLITGRDAKEHRPDGPLCPMIIVVCGRNRSEKIRSNRGFAGCGRVFPGHIAPCARARASSKIQQHV